MVSMVLILATLLVATNAQSNSLWIDCHPDFGATPERCRSRGCIWQAKTVPGAPWCEFPANNLSTMAGYDANGVVITEFPLARGSGDVVQAKLRRRPTPTLFGNDFQKGVIKIEQITDQILRILINDQQQINRRAVYPEWKLHLHDSGAVRAQLMNAVSQDSIFDVKFENSPFGFAVLRKSTGVPLIDTRRIPGFTFAQQYLQISMRVPTRYVYGLGDTTHESLVHDFNYRKWGLFARDNGPGQGDINLYGVHPFYLCIDDDSGNTHGVFFLNTHAMNVALQPDPSNPNGGIITWRTIGGLFEIFVLSGPTPDDVMRQYTSLIGRPQLPPYWALGFQLSRYGYRNETFLSKIFQRNRAAAIPQDVQFMDIDYMDKYMDFTSDSVAFANLTGFIQSLHDQYKMKLVLIVDPGIASRPVKSYDPLISGLRSNVFIRDNRTGKPLEGKVWPGYTFYPDFTNPDAHNWWSDVMKNFHEQKGVHFDGIWIDMNEPSNFVAGSVDSCFANKLNKPPYNPLIYTNINDKTVCMDADQHLGKHYEMHNLYGYTESIATYKALQDLFPGKRPFILSRSTFAGSGKYTNHWTGDNRSLWPHMKMSIIATLEFNLFGIPMTGADICGFGGETTEEMCIRWMQLGSFYPYSRNHNDIDSKVEQDPAAWSRDGTAIIRQALILRYSILPYMYTLFHQAYVNGTTVARPVFFDYASDKATRTIDDQFLLGSGLMVAPVITQGTTRRHVYFPQGRWYELVSHSEVPSPESGRGLDMNMPLDSIGLYLRGGAILPWQGPGMNTVESRKNDFGLLVAMDENSRACGSLYWDDGDTENGPYSLAQFEAWRQGDQGGLHVVMLRTEFNIEPPLNTMLVYGMQSKPANVKVDGVQMPAQNVEYNADTRTLRLKNLGIRLNAQHEITWQFGSRERESE